MAKPIEMLVVPFEKIQEMKSIDVSNMVEKRLGLDYLSWAHAELLLRQHFPTFKVMYELEEVTRGDTTYVAVHSWLLDLATGLETPREYFPVMDGTNRRGNVADPGPREISDAIKRAGVKVIARETGIGLSLYLKDKDDLPEEKLERPAYSKPVREIAVDISDHVPDVEAAPAPRKTTLRKLT